MRSYPLPSVRWCIQWMHIMNKLWNSHSGLMHYSQVVCVCEHTQLSKPNIGICIIKNPCMHVYIHINTHTWFFKCFTIWSPTMNRHFWFWNFSPAFQLQTRDDTPHLMISVKLNLCLPSARVRLEKLLGGKFFLSSVRIGVASSN